MSLPSRPVTLTLPLAAAAFALLAGWTGTEAVGTGTEKIDDCTPNCAAGTLHPVRVTVTFSKPVQAGCAAAGKRLYWTRASFTWPGGLPSALTGDNAPTNPFDFSGVTGNTCP
jgi:hypothetical protein